MAKKMTKTQTKNMIRAMQNKATKLFLHSKGPDGKPVLTIGDVGKINDILLKADRKLR